MAIVHMKKLRLMVVRRQKDELLRDLMLLGCRSRNRTRCLRIRRLPQSCVRRAAM